MAKVDTRDTSDTTDTSTTSRCKCQCGPSIRCNVCQCAQCEECDEPEHAINCAQSSCSNLLFIEENTFIYNDSQTIWCLCKKCVPKKQWSKPSEMNCSFRWTNHCGSFCTDCAPTALLQCTHCTRIGCVQGNHYQTQLRACYECCSYCYRCKKGILDKDSWVCDSGSFDCLSTGRLCQTCATSVQIANVCINKDCANNRALCRNCQPQLAKSLCTDCRLTLETTLVRFAKTVYVEQSTRLLQMNLPPQCPLQLRALILHYANIFHPDNSIQELHSAFSVSTVPGFPFTGTQGDAADNAKSTNNVCKRKISDCPNSVLFDDSTMEQFVI